MLQAKPFTKEEMVMLDHSGAPFVIKALHISQICIDISGKLMQTWPHTSVSTVTRVSIMPGDWQLTS